jgi:hypothetical protein
VTAKPITTDLNPAPEQPPADGAAAGILSDLKGSEEAAAMGDLSLGARPKRRLSMQTLVLVLVLVASAGALYLMRRQGMEGGMKFKTPAIAHELDKAPPSSTSEVRILADLAKSSMPQRDAEARLQKNPFLLDGPVEGGTAAVPNLDAERQSMIKDRLSGIHLNGVMEGPTPLARLNDRLVRVGDIVEDVFLVAQIHDRSVDLIADGHTYSVNMGEGAPAANTVKRPGGKAPTPPPPAPKH